MHDIEVVAKVSSISHSATLILFPWLFILSATTYTTNICSNAKERMFESQWFCNDRAPNIYAELCHLKFMACGNIVEMYCVSWINWTQSFNTLEISMFFIHEISAVDFHSFENVQSSNWKMQWKMWLRNCLNPFSHPFFRMKIRLVVETLSKKSNWNEKTKNWFNPDKRKKSQIYRHIKKALSNSKQW